MEVFFYEKKYVSSSLYGFNIEFKLTFKRDSLSVADFKNMIGNLVLKAQKLNPSYRLFLTSLRHYVITGKSAKYKMRIRIFCVLTIINH